jgi:hypothetical protein
MDQVKHIPLLEEIAEQANLQPTIEWLEYYYFN